jgi:DNA-directed RNA polymerase alpha subunit
MTETHRFANIETTNNITSAVFLTRDIAEVNLLRRAILSEIETYAIDIVTFHHNTSSRHDEVIALRLGQLVIDHSRFRPPPEGGDFTTHIDFQGPGEFTTEHIPDLPFLYITPIATLKAGQRITCDVIVKRGQGKRHVKWRPISTFKFTEVEQGYKVTFKNIGMLSGTEILEKGLAKMRDAAQRPPITLFSHPLVPNNI